MEVRKSEEMNDEQSRLFFSYVVCVTADECELFESDAQLQSVHSAADDGSSRAELEREHADGRCDCAAADRVVLQL